MREDKLQMFRNRLTKTYKHLAKSAARQKISCFRIFDHDLPEFPLIIERYGDDVYVAEYKRKHRLDDHAHEVWLADSVAVIAEVLGVNTDQIFTRLRQKKAGRAGQYRKTGEFSPEKIVEENNLKFLINLEDYLDTGLFLDHRTTRKMVMDESRGKRVLNLFAYTGSFSVYAAAGGAISVTTVDLSKTYLERAQRNMALNWFTGDNYQIVAADVMQYLPNQQEHSFELIVLDPPTFSNSKKMENVLDIQQHHVSLINQCCRLLTPGGILYFSTNYSKFQLRSSEIQATEIKDITRATTPFDFEGKLKRYCFRIVSP